MKKVAKNLLRCIGCMLIAGIFISTNLFAFVSEGNNSGSQNRKQRQSLTYIDVSIYQPNVEDCYEVSVPDTDMDYDWIKIYPNPNPGLFTLELNLQQPEVDLEIHIYDITGKLVFQTRETPDGSHFHKDIDVSYFQKGVYFIRIMGKDRVGVKQIIIN